MKISFLASMEKKFFGSVCKLEIMGNRRLVSLWRSGPAHRNREMKHQRETLSHPSRRMLTDHVDFARAVHVGLYDMESRSRSLYINSELNTKIEVGIQGQHTAVITGEVVPSRSKCLS